MGFRGKMSKAGITDKRKILEVTITWELCNVIVLAAVNFCDWVATPVALAKGLACLGVVATVFGIFLILRLVRSLGLI